MKIHRGGALQIPCSFVASLVANQVTSEAEEIRNKLSGGNARTGYFHSVARPISRQPMKLFYIDTHSHICASHVVCDLRRIISHIFFQPVINLSFHRQNTLEILCDLQIDLRWCDNLMFNSSTALTIAASSSDAWLCVGISSDSARADF